MRPKAAQRNLTEVSRPRPPPARAATGGPERLDEQGQHGAIYFRLGRATDDHYIMPDGPYARAFARFQQSGYQLGRRSAPALQAPL